MKVRDLIMALGETDLDLEVYVIPTEGSDWCREVKSCAFGPGSRCVVIEMSSTEELTPGISES